MRDLINYFQICLQLNILHRQSFLNFYYYNFFITIGV